METDNSISKTGLDKIESSPLDYWWNYRNPRRPAYVPDKKTIFDNALRSAILTPSEFGRTYVRQPIINKSTNIGRSEFAALESLVSENGQTLILGTDFDTIMEMRDSVLKSPAAKMIFENGVAERRLSFVEENSGAVVKFKSHWQDNSNGLIVHLTSVSDASETQFAKDTYNFSNHKRAALQMDGYSAIGEPMDGFVFVNVEKEAPYKVSVFYLDNRSVELGRETYIRNCITFAECLKSGKWPGLKETVSAVSLPEWAFK